MTIRQIAGDTPQERKKNARKLLQCLGIEVDLTQIVQKNKSLSIVWFPPFSGEFMAQTKKLATVGAVYFGPTDTEATLRYVDFRFEEQPGLFVDDPLTRRPTILTSLDRLPVLLAYHVDLMKRVEEQQAILRARPPEPEQQDLWPEDNDE